jgi:nitroreductase
MMERQTDRYREGTSYMLKTNDATSSRQPLHDVDALFLERWSPRSFSDKPVSDELLFRLFESARWAPSAFNHQPWRFILLRGSDKERVHQCISDNNLLWCSKAPVLVMFLSEKSRNGVPNRSHAFDTGAAWSHFALAATKAGLITHPMTGFDFEKARDILQVPEEYELQALVAVGYQGPADALPDHLREREMPNQRRPIEQSVYVGTFGQPLGRE